MKRQFLPTAGGYSVKMPAFSRNQATVNQKMAEYGKSGVITTQGYIRCEVAVTGALSTLSFKVTENAGNALNNEKRLKNSDTFTVTDVAFYWGKTIMAGASPTPTEYSNMRLATFPNPQVFTGGTAAANMQAIYNGYMTLRVDTTTFIDSYPMQAFYRVATSQEQAAAANQNAVQRDEWPLQMYGRSQWTPTIELNGQSTIDLSITLPGNQSVNMAAGAATYQTNAVVYLLGFLNQGASSTQKALQKQLRNSGVKGISDADIGLIY